MQETPQQHVDPCAEGSTEDSSLRFRFSLRSILLSTIAAAGIFAVAGLVFRHDAGPLEVDFGEPNIEIGWDLKHAEHSDWQLSEVQAGDLTQYVLTVPRDATRLNPVGVYPQVRVEVIDTTSIFTAVGSAGYNSWGTSVLLTWDGQKLDLEPGAKIDATPESYSFNTGYVTPEPSLTRISPTTLEIAYRLAYRRFNREDEPVEREIRIRIEVVAEPPVPGDTPATDDRD